MEVIVKIIKTNPWTGVTKWATCFDYVGSYWTRSGNRYTGLTAAQAKDLENKIGYAEGTLSQHSDFWKTFTCKIGRDGITLNTENPYDELQYLFLKNHKRVADGVSNIKPASDYLMTNGDTEAEQINKLNKVKREAYREMDKMSIEDMRKCLRLYGIKSDTMSNELIEAKMSEQIEKSPKNFIMKWVENPNKEINFVIEEAVSKNIIRKNRSNYYFGTDLIGNGLEDVIAYLKDKKNNDIKMAILNEIKSK